jgi:hypothetical protein
LEPKKIDVDSEKTYLLVVKLASFHGNKPIANVNIKVFMLEKAPITLNQWAENLKNGTPFKKLVISMNTEENGNISTNLAEGSYEVEVEKYDLRKVCELTKDENVVFIAPKEHWWQ